MSGVLLSQLLTLQSTDPPSFVETQAVVNRLKWGKASGISGIHAELLKAGENAVLMSLHAVLCSAWNTGVIPTDWKRGLVVPLWKGKGDRQDCNNYRGVTLLSQMRFVTCIVHEHQLHLYGHVARFADADPAHQILSAREPHEWRRPNMPSTSLVVAAC